MWFYIAARNLGTTAPKINVFSSVLKGKKFSILKAFHGATAFCGANANTIPYNITFVNLRVRAYLPSRHSKPFSERNLISSRKANCRKRSLQKCNKHALTERWIERPKRGKPAFSKPGPSLRAAHIRIWATSELKE